MRYVSRRSCLRSTREDSGSDGSSIPMRSSTTNHDGEQPDVHRGIWHLKSLDVVNQSCSLKPKAPEHACDWSRRKIPPPHTWASVLRVHAESNHGVVGV